MTEVKSELSLMIGKVEAILDGWPKRRSFAKQEKGGNRLVPGSDYIVDALKFLNQAPRVSASNGSVVDSRDLNLVFVHLEATHDKLFPSSPTKYTVEPSWPLVLDFTPSRVTNWKTIAKKKRSLEENSREGQGPLEAGFGEVPLRHGGTLISRRSARPLVRLVKGEERWEASDHPQRTFSPLPS
ncbi:hypothetical protein TNCV_1202371 [Trichonephila clavipes]|nr:hypothetical protein TNCV_1202371 [Trichonephila clavipes]